MGINIVIELMQYLTQPQGADSGSSFIIQPEINTGRGRRVHVEDGEKERGVKESVRTYWQENEVD